MKKIVSLIVVLLLGCCLLTISFAEEIELGSLSFEDLSALKQKVDFEFQSRPEAEPFKLAEGQYVAGVDLVPGRYYMACIEAGDSAYSARLHVYKDRATYDARPSGYYGEYLVDEHFGVGEEGKSINLEAGNFLLLQNGSLLISLTAFNPGDYFQYTLPEGTVVPAGVYDVGADGDIPAGKYNAFAGTASGGDLKLYYSKEKFESDGSWHLGYDKHYKLAAAKNPQSEGLVLEEGYVVLVQKDIVMKKQQKLSFD